jgi:hypothetical protein
VRARGFPKAPALLAPCRARCWSCVLFLYDAWSSKTHIVSSMLKPWIPFSHRQISSHQCVESAPPGPGFPSHLCPSCLPRKSQMVPKPPEQPQYPFPPGCRQPCVLREYALQRLASVRLLLAATFDSIPIAQNSRTTARILVWQGSKAPSNTSTGAWSSPGIIDASDNLLLPPPFGYPPHQGQGLHSERRKCQNLAF